jgi:hypothetical protein
MGVFDKVKDKAEQLIGEAKEKIGQLTGNESLENAGKRDQLLVKPRKPRMIYATRLPVRSRIPGIDWTTTSNLRAVRL